MLKKSSTLKRLILFALTLSTQLLSLNVEGQAVDSIPIAGLKEAKSKILHEASANASFVHGTGSYLYTVENFIKLFDQGRIAYYVSIDGKYKRVSRTFKRKSASVIYVYKDTRSRVVLVSETINHNDNGWGGTREYYFNPEGSLFARTISAVQQVGLDHFDEIRITTYFHKEKIIETERRCFGSSETCLGWEQLKFSRGTTVEEWFTLKGINLEEKSFYDKQ